MLDSISLSKCLIKDVFRKRANAKCGRDSIYELQVDNKKRRDIGELLSHGAALDNSSKKTV